jgi:PIN domain nuclease of toxin-antitoxin system
MIVAIADTHAAIWYVFGYRRLSPAISEIARILHALRCKVD